MTPNPTPIIPPARGPLVTRWWRRLFPAAPAGHRPVAGCQDPASIAHWLIEDRTGFAPGFIPERFDAARCR